MNFSNLAIDHDIGSRRIPNPFKCDMRPRSQQACGLIKQSDSGEGSSSSHVA